MSNRWNNPYASGYPNYLQNQYRPSRQSERGTVQEPYHGGPGSSLSSFAASSTTLNNPGPTPLFLNPPVTHRPEQRMVSSEMTVDKAIRFYVTRAREKAVHQTLSHGSQFTNTQREEILPFTSTVEPSYPDTSRPKISDANSRNNVLSWLQICKTPMEYRSSSFKSSAPSDFPGTSDGRGFTSTERQRGSQSVHGLSSYVNPTSESHSTWYSQELAADILHRFGLEEDDLQYLLSYPEDQINSDNLPHILKQIILQKQNRAALRPDPQPGPSVDEKDRSKMSGKSLSSMPSNTVKVSKAIEYGHTGMHSLTGTEPGRTSRVTSGGSESMFGFDAPGSSSYKEPLQQISSKMKTSDVVPSQSQSATSFSWIKSAVVPPVSIPTKQQLSQASKSSFASAPPPKKDTDSKPLNLEFTSQDLKQVQKHPFEAAKQPEKEKLVNQENKQITESNQAVNPTKQLAQLQQQFQQQQLMLQTQLQQTFQQQQLMWQAQLQQKLQLQTAKQAQPQLINQQPINQQPILQTGQTLLPHGIPAVPPVSSLSFIPRPVGVFSPQQPNQNPFQYLNYVPSPGNQQFLGTVCNGNPPLVNIRDYAASTPTMFPHVCSLCLTKCDTIMDWLAHQNLPLHLENCKTLRRRYPEWDGKLTPVSTQANKRARSRSPRYHLSSRDVRKNSRISSCSRSHSPRRHRNRRSSSRSRSRSRYHGSESKRRRRSSRSHEKSSSRSNDKKRSRRSRDRQWPSDRSPPQRARSTSAERLARRLVNSSGFKSLSDPFDLEAVVKALTPGLLAELTKGKPASCSSSSAVRPHEEESEDEVRSNQVLLVEVSSALSHKDVVDAVQQFGETQSVVLYRSRQEAIVRYTKEEDAEKLRSIKNFEVKGHLVKVIREECTVLKPGCPSAGGQILPQQQDPAESDVSTSKSTESSSTRETKISTKTAAEATETDADSQLGAAEEQPTAAEESVLVKDAEETGEVENTEAEEQPTDPSSNKEERGLHCPPLPVVSMPFKTYDEQTQKAIRAHEVWWTDWSSTEVKSNKLWENKMMQYNQFVHMPQRAPANKHTKKLSNKKIS